MPNTLKLSLQTLNRNPLAMGSNFPDNIILYLINIYNEHHSSFNELVRGINRTYLIELICSISTEGKWALDGVLNKDVPCFQKPRCPIDIIMKYGMFMLAGFFE